MISTCTASNKGGGKRARSDGVGRVGQLCEIMIAVECFGCQLRIQLSPHLCDGKICTGTQNPRCWLGGSVRRGLSMFVIVCMMCIHCALMRAILLNWPDMSVREKSCWGEGWRIIAVLCGSMRLCGVLSQLQCCQVVIKVLINLPLRYSPLI